MGEETHRVFNSSSIHNNKTYLGWGARHRFALFFFIFPRNFEYFFNFPSLFLKKSKAKNKNKTK